MAGPILSKEPISGSLSATVVGPFISSGHGDPPPSGPISLISYLHSRAVSKSHYDVQFPPDGSVERSISSLDQAARDELSKVMFLRLQNEPDRGDGILDVVPSPTEPGVLFMWGHHCIIRYTIDPIQQMVRVISVAPTAP